MLSVGPHELIFEMIRCVGNISKVKIYKRAIASDLNLHLRDLRIIDPTIPKQIRSAFIARPQAILFSIENIKAIVCYNKAIIFGPDQLEVKEFISVVQKLVEHAVVKDDEEWKFRDRYLSNWIHVMLSIYFINCRFEHIVLEAALNVVCSHLIQRVRSLASNIENTLQGFQAQTKGFQDVIIRRVDELLPLKNSLDELRKRVKDLKRALTDTLNSDDDLKMMYLDVSQEESKKLNEESLHDSETDQCHPLEKQSRGCSPNLNVMSIEMIFEVKIKRNSH